MTISIVMSCYNGEGFILQQLDSINSQTILPNEIILIDDFSKDNTKNMILKYPFNEKINIKYIQHEKNIGYRDTFLEGICESEGDIIFLSDQDDIWDCRKIEYICKCFENNEKILALNTNYKTIDLNGNIMKEPLRRRRWYKKLNVCNMKYIIKYNISPGCTMAFRKKIVNDIRVNISTIKKNSLPHDWLINLISSLQGGTYYLNKKLTFYRLHRNQTFGLRRSKTIAERVMSYENFLRYKKEMYDLIKYLNPELYQKNVKEFKLTLRSYKSVIISLKNENIFEYMSLIFKNNIIKYISTKSVVLDLLILLKSILYLDKQYSVK